MWNKMGSMVSVCTGGVEAKRAAHDRSTDQLLSQFRKEQAETQHQIQLEEERLNQLTSEAKRHKSNAMQIANKRDPAYKMHEERSKESLASRKQVEIQLQRLRNAAHEQTETIHRLEALRSGGPKINLYKQAKKQIEGYSAFIEVENMAELKDELDECWRNSEALQEPVRRINENDLEIEREFNSLDASGTATTELLHNIDDMLLDEEYEMAHRNEQRQAIHNA